MIISYARMCMFAAIIIAIYNQFSPTYLVQGLLWISIMLYEQKERGDENNRRAMRNRNR